MNKINLFHPKRIRTLKPQMQTHVYQILASGTKIRITDFRIGLGFASNAAGILS
jgi:hypothetical protein